MSASRVAGYNSGETGLTDDIADGCFVVIFEDRDYLKAKRLIPGPIEISKLAGVSGDWDDKISSVIVGPHAEVQFFEDDDFDGDSITYKPNEHVSYVGDDWNDKFGSLQLCAK